MLPPTQARAGQLEKQRGYLEAMWQRQREDLEAWLCQLEQQRAELQARLAEVEGQREVLQAKWQQAQEAAAARTEAAAALRAEQLEQAQVW